MYWWHCGGPWFWGFAIFPLFFFIMMIFCFSRWFRYGRRWSAEAGSRYGRRSFCGCGSWRGWNRDASWESAEEILDRRYASGEITQEEYQRMKREIETDRRET